MATRTRRFAAVAIVSLVVAIVLAVVLVSYFHNGSGSRPATTPTGASSSEPESTGKWLSGASGNGVTDGSFDAWRGRDLDIIGTWADDNANMVQFYQLQKSGNLNDWTGPLDIAIGAIGDGETWDAAATGAYDERWRKSLEKLKSSRAAADGQTYIRFAHEMNGDWYPWKVTASSSASFIEAWKHFRALQQEIYPEAKLVFSVNRESVGTGMDWTKLFPGAEYVDLLSVDYYNQNPTVTTPDNWASSIDEVDQWGGPKGLAKHLAFAKSVGLPLAISEWSGMATSGDSPQFVTSFLDYVRDHSGTGAGQIPYEILFDVPQNQNNFVLFGDGSRMPESSAAYQKFFAQE